MSLITKPYKPANVTDGEQPLSLLDMAQRVELIAPDGSSEHMRMFEALCLSAVYLRRKLNVAVRTTQGAMVFELTNGEYKITPFFMEALRSISHTINAEVDYYSAKAVAAALAQQDGTPTPRQPAAVRPAPESQPAVEPAPVADYAEDSTESNGSDESSRAGNRFRRGRR